MNDGTSLGMDESARVGLLDRVTLPWHVSLGKTLEHAFVHNPLMATFDFGELLSANSQIARNAIGNVGRFSADMAPEMLGEAPPEAADAFVDPKTLNEKYGKSTGLSFDQPTRAGAVSIMVRRKQEEIARNAFIDRAPGGFWYGAASFATQLAVSATDPLNVASAFIPVVGESRFAIWSARYGKTAARALTGTVEGAVGAAVIEPINYGAATYLGDDYTMADSIMNVALGGVLGGGLHVGFGAISDRLSRLAPETREATLRGAIANMAEGRPVDIDHIIATDGSPRFNPSEAAAPDTAPSPDMPAARAARAPDVPSTTKGLTADQAAEVQGLLGFQTAKGSTYEAHPDGTTTRNKAARPDPGHEGQFGPQPRSEKTFYVTKEHADELSLFQTQGGGKMAIGETSDGRLGVKYLDGKDAGKFETRTVAETAKAPAPGLIPVEVWNGGERVHFGNEITKTGQLVRGARPDAKAATDAARTATVAYGKNAEPGTAIPPDASARGDAILKEKLGDDLDVELQEANATIDAYEKQGALTPAEAEQARSGKEGIAEAAKRGRAAKAAAVCLNLHP